MAHVTDPSLVAGSDPFLKWPGGKRWLAPIIVPYFKSSRARYVEAFLGGGAIFFALEPNRALLADANADLIACYAAIRTSPKAIINRLRSMPISESVFKEVRASTPTGSIRKAVRLLYLNRLSFNGIYRVNRAGAFNVPFGPKPGTELCRPNLIYGCSLALRKAELLCGDFRETLSRTRITDLVYLDPPYTVAHNNNGFRRYNESIFSWQDQQDLADWSNRFAARGGRVIVSNAWHSDVVDLYSPGLFAKRRFDRFSPMAASPAARGQRSELLAVSRSLQ